MNEMPKWLKIYLDRTLIDEEGIWIYEDIPTDWGNLLEYDIYAAMATEMQSQADCELIRTILDQHSSSVVKAIQKLSKDIREEFTQIRNARCSICQQSPITDTSLRICQSCQTQHLAEVHKVKVHLYRAKRANVPATLTISEWLTTLKKFEYKCAYCQDKPYEVLEHYIPIPTKPNTLDNPPGGTTATNCIPACRSCNAQKGGRQP